MPSLGRIPGSYFVRTFGCQMNLHDSEHISGVLERAGYTQAPDVDSAWLVVFNTCCVRKSAEDRVWGNLGRLASPENGAPLVAVSGCMAYSSGHEIHASGRAGIVFSTDRISDLPSLIELAAEGPVLALGDPEAARIDALPARRRSALRAWVPVSHGCDNNCSYCVVPYVRGPQRSRVFAEVLEEVELLARDGVLEVTLLGQNVNSCGSDIDEPGFADLLASVAAVEGIERVKFETSHPRDLDEETIMSMRDSPEVCQHLHLPVQSGSDRILSAMNRGYDSSYYIELVESARREIPGLILTTDIIVGFPGETDENFRRTLDLARLVRFDSAYTFIYSRREGTPAAGMKEEVPHAVKKKRFDELCAITEAQTSASIASRVGNVEQVLIEGPARRGGMPSGRTRGGMSVIFDRDVLDGEALVKAEITGAGRHAARGRIVEILHRPS